ncbi:MAG: hypothetical protein RBS51_07260 [Anaerovoracaceae bacterium]|jgi:hypothetical protein|nr:hypothetical protein [Anaerovoracaceae bacterium]
MKKAILLVMVLVMFSFLACSSLEETKEDAEIGVYTKEEMVLKITGTWVNEEYKNNLTSTKSPYRSICELPWLEILADNNEIFYNEYLNFHEGGTGGTITDIVFDADNNRYDIELKSYFENSLIELQPSIIISENPGEGSSIIYTNQEGEIVHQFFQIDKSPALYANEVILAGSYKDSEGNQYTFTNDGKAIWPQESFDYQIQLDFIGQPTFADENGDFYEADYFMRVSKDGLAFEDSIYSYEIKGEQLLIFKGHGQEGLYLYQLNKNPDLVLTKQVV